MSLRIFLIVIFTSFLSLVSNGQVSVEVNAPNVVAVGEIFRIEFSVNSKKTDQFKIPKFDGIRVVASSNYESYENINGKRSERETRVFVVSIDSAGTYTIPPAEVSVDGKTYKTKEVKIKAILENNNNKNTNSQRNTSQDNQNSSVANDDYILRLEPSKSSVYKGEPIIVSIKLYVRGGARMDIRNLDLPAFNGFWIQRIDNQDSKQWTRETLNDKIYNTATIAEYLLYPQNSGKIVIDKCKLNLIIYNLNRRPVSVFDMIDDERFTPVEKMLTTQPVSITIKDFPAEAPEGFNGAVGQFSISADINPLSMSANSAGTYTLKLSGTGNMSMIQTPKVEFPQTFEVYNVKVSDNLKNTTEGISGTKRFDYPFIPRAEGNYKIEPFKFVYFNTKSNKYVTLSTDSFDLNITADSTSKGHAAGMVSGISKEDLKIIGKDIRFINTTQLKLTPKGYFFVWSIWYIIILIVIMAAFVVAVILIKRTIKMRGNQVLMRGRAASKRALKRFRTAENDMIAGNEKEFYAEMLRALWGYISDKLNIPQSQLTKENILEQMVLKGISESLSNEYLNIISECEFAQYAPVQSNVMKDIFDRSSKIIVEIESKITSKK